MANKELKSYTFIYSCTQSVPDIGEKISGLDPRRGPEIQFFSGSNPGPAPGRNKHEPAAL